LRLKNQEILVEDWILVIIAMIIVGLSFVLVVPYRGKTTIVGYLTSTETDQYWGERAGSSGGFPKGE